MSVSFHLNSFSLLYSTVLSRRTRLPDYFTGLNTELSCTVQYGTVLNCTVYYGTVLNCTVPYGTVLNCPVQYGRVLN